MSDAKDQPTSTTVSSSGFFESIGQKADQLAPSNTTANGGANSGDEDNDRVVEQIESLCMNCHENVGDNPTGFPVSHC